MKKNIPLYILLVFLIVVNGFFIYQYLGRPESRDRNEPKDPMAFIAKQLKFDAQQMQQMESLNHSHLKKMMRFNNEEKKLKDLLFSNLSDVVINKKKIDSITTLIGNKGKEKDTEAFYHFKSIQELCDEKQKETFQKIIKDALHKGRGEPQGIPDGRNGPPPPPNH